MPDHTALLDSVPDPELCGMWLMWHCFVAYCDLDFHASVAFADRAIAIGEECDLPRVLAYALTQKTWALLNMGRSSEGLVCAERALGPWSTNSPMRGIAGMSA